MRNALIALGLVVVLIVLWWPVNHLIDWYHKKQLVENMKVVQIALEERNPDGVKPESGVVEYVFYNFDEYLSAANGFKVMRNPFTRTGQQVFCGKKPAGLGRIGVEFPDSTTYIIYGMGRKGLISTVIKATWGTSTARPLAKESRAGVAKEYGPVGGAFLGLGLILEPILAMIGGMYSVAKRRIHPGLKLLSILVIIVATTQIVPLLLPRSWDLMAPFKASCQKFIEDVLHPPSDTYYPPYGS